MALKTLYDCTALITGASSGIGREIALQLAPDVGTLVLVARRKDRLESLQSEISLINPAARVYVYGCDIGNRSQLESLVRWIRDEDLPLNLLVNNAGLGDFGYFADADWERGQAMLDVNVNALTRLTHAVLPGMLRRGEGAILNVSSTAGFVPIPKMAVYAATKAFVTSFGEAVRAELDGTGVSVTSLCPGPVRTEFHDVARRGADGGHFQSPEWFQVPVGRVAAEALEAVVHDRPRVIPGLAVCLAVTALSLVPICLLRGLMRRVARRD